MHIVRVGRQKGVISDTRILKYLSSSIFLTFYAKYLTQNVIHIQFCKMCFIKLGIAPRHRILEYIERTSNRWMLTANVVKKVNQILRDIYI